MKTSEMSKPVSCINGAISHAENIRASIAFTRSRTERESLEKAFSTPDGSRKNFIDQKRSGVSSTLFLMHIFIAGIVFLVEEPGLDACPTNFHFYYATPSRRSENRFPFHESVLQFSFRFSRVVSCVACASHYRKARSAGVGTPAPARAGVRRRQHRRRCMKVKI